MTNDEIEHIVNHEPVDPWGEVDLILDLRSALKKLSGYDLLLLHLAIEAHMPLTEVASIVGVSRQRVTAQVKQALIRVRKEMES